MSKTETAKDRTDEIVGMPALPESCTCPKCVEVRSKAIKLRDPLLWRGDEVHSSGAVIHWDWRNPVRIKVWILITCHLCGHNSFVRKQSVLRSWKGGRVWRGLCSPCVKLPYRRTLKGTYKNALGATIYFDKSPHDGNKAWVGCPNNSTCGGLEQRRVDKYNIDTQPFYCSKCLSRTRSSNLTEAWSLKLGSGNLQSEQPEKGTWGGERKTYWTKERRQDLLTLYEETLKRIKEKDSGLPEEIKAKLRLRGNKPSEIALEYAAMDFKDASIEYLRRDVLTKARQERVAGGGSRSS